MSTDIHSPVPPTAGPSTIEQIVAQAVHLAMSRDWTAAAAGQTLLESATADPDLLRRARVQLLKTNTPHSQLCRRALLSLAYAAAVGGGVQPSGPSAASAG